MNYKKILFTSLIIFNSPNMLKAPWVDRLRDLRDSALSSINTNPQDNAVALFNDMLERGDAAAGPLVSRLLHHMLTSIGGEECYSSKNGINALTIATFDIMTIAGVNCVLWTILNSSLLLRIHPFVKQAPQDHPLTDAVNVSCQSLGVPTLDVFIKQDPRPKIYTQGNAIVVTTAMVEKLLGEDETNRTCARFAIGYELARAKEYGEVVSIVELLTRISSQAAGHYLGIYGNFATRLGIDLLRTRYLNQSIERSLPSSESLRQALGFAGPIDENFNRVIIPYASSHRPPILSLAVQFVGMRAWPELAKAGTLSPAAVLRNALLTHDINTTAEFFAKKCLKSAT